MNELRALFPRPRLSPFFASKVCSRLPKRGAPSAWMRVYWTAAAIFAAFVLARVHWPGWVPLAAVPAGFAVVLGSRSGVLRLLAPFLR